MSTSKRLKPTPIEKNPNTNVQSQSNSIGTRSPPTANEVIELITAFSKILPTEYAILNEIIIDLQKGGDLHSNLSKLIKFQQDYIAHM